MPPVLQFSNEASAVNQKTVAQSQKSLPTLTATTENPAPGFDPELPYFPIFYNDVYQVTLPDGHRFPMEKYRQVRELVQEEIGAGGKQLENEQQQQQQQQQQHNAPLHCNKTAATVVCDFHLSPLATREELATTHDADYVERFLNGNMSPDEMRSIGFPWTTSKVDRALSSTGGTVAAACAVCEARRILGQFEKNGRKDSGQNDVGGGNFLDGESDQSPSMQPTLTWSAHIAGGTHHAFFDRGEGFCVFSDIAVAANVVLQRYPDVVRRVLILDLDVHQGNGNAVLFQGRDDVSTFSMHCSANYFSKKEKSDLDVELPPGCTDETYLMTLQHWLKRMRLAGGNFDLIFFQAGVDILEQDRLGRMNITSKGVNRRNELVFDFCRAVGAPLVITMGGGYPASKDWTPILEAHANVYIQAKEYLSRPAHSKD